MGIKESSATSLNSAFFMRNFYKENKNAYKTATRKKYSSDEKSYEDSRALRRAAKQLTTYGYDANDIKDNVTSAISAYADTYNNTIKSAADSSDKDVARYAKKLKSMTAEHEDALSKLGIKLEKDGTMTVNTDFLKERDLEDLKKTFGKENGFMMEVMSISRKITNNTQAALYEQLTGNGSILNVTI